MSPSALPQGPQGEEAPRPSGGAGALVPLVLATMASQGMLVVLAPTIVEVGRSLDVSVAAVGQARSIAAAAAIATSPLVPSMLARFGLAGLLRAGVALAIVGSVAAAAAPSLAVYFAAHVVAGAAIGGLLSAGFAGVASFPAGERGWAMGYVASANALAWIVANPVIGLLTDAVSWRAAQLVPVGLALAALASSGRMPSLVERPAPRGALRTVVGNRGGRRWAVAELLAYCAWAGALLTFIGAYFVERHGVEESVAGFLLAAGAGAYAAASVRSGALTSRFDRERLMRAAALGMAALLVALFTLDLSLAVHVGLFCAIGLLAGIRTPASAGLGMAQLPAQPGVMMAARTATTQLGYLLGAVAAGAVLGLAGYATLGAVLAGVLAASAWVMGGVPDPEARRSGS